MTEQVPCTTYVTRCITEQVPYTVTRKVRYNEVRQVPYTVRRHVRGAYCDGKGGTYDCEGPGRTFQEGGVIRKQVPYTVSKNVTTVEKKMVPYTVTRCARGAYCDGHGEFHGQDGPGRSFREGAHFKVTNTTTTCRMVQEQHVKKVQYTVWENVMEKHTKKVPYQVCRMVPTTITKKVPHTVCEMQQYTVCRKVPYTECIQQPYTVRCKVPYTETITVPCTVRKQVSYCVPETVCVRKARMVPVATDPGCPSDPCGPKTNCDPCQQGHGHGRKLFGGHGLGRHNDCCQSSCNTRGCDRCDCHLSQTRQRWFASLHSTGCCEETCRTGSHASTACHTNNNCGKAGHGGHHSRGWLFGRHGQNDNCCEDNSHNFCREGLLQRLFRNRFCCEPTCCNTGCGPTGCVGGACGPTHHGVVPTAPVDAPLPKAMPK